MSFHESNDSTNNVKALKEDRVLRIRLQSHQIHPTMLTIIQWESEGGGGEHLAKMHISH